jgi:acetoin utilization protein AcuB
MPEARSLMTKKIVTVKVVTPIQAAYDEMREHGIRHLPVVDQFGKLVGMLSDRDLLRASNTKVLNEIEQEMTFNPHYIVEDFMSWPVQTVSEQASIEDVAKLMIEQKVSAVVVNGPNQYIKGIITSEDLMQYLVDLLHRSEESRMVPIQHLYWRGA